MKIRILYLVSVFQILVSKISYVSADIDIVKVRHLRFYNASQLKTLVNWRRLGGGVTNAATNRLEAPGTLR